MSIFHPNVDLTLTLAMWERQRKSLCENENSMSTFNQKSCFCIKNVDFSLEKCRFGAKKGVSHYVLRRDFVIFAKNDNFELEICVKARGGRAARCMGSVPVADLLASEALYGDPSLCLFLGHRSRESCGTWQLPQIICC